MMQAPVAWADVVAEHRPELVRIARSRLGSSADAEDVVHEVLLRVLRTGRAGAVDTPAAYLRRAVVNECITRWRRTGRDVPVAAVPDLPAADPADRCVDRLLIHTALGGLTERQRRVITLTVLGGWADAEAAAALGICQVTVRTTRLRALGRLRGILAEPAAARGSRPAATVARSEAAAPARERTGTPAGLTTAA